MLKSLALQIVHTLLGGSITGWIRGINFISSAEFKYLLSMVDRTPYHLGLVVADSFYHQASDARGHNIFAGPFIT